MKSTNNADVLVKKDGIYLQIKLNANMGMAEFAEFCVREKDNNLTVKSQFPVTNILYALAEMAIESKLESKGNYTESDAILKTIMAK
jgi:hypothetical protein